MFGPRLTGEKIVLRPPRIEEAGIICAWFADPDVTVTLMSMAPPSLEMENEWLRKAAADPDTVIWAIDFEERLVGTTAISGISWRDLSATTGTVIGDKTAWGKGVGSEAMRLRTRYAFTELPLRKLKSAYLEGNEASRKAQAKIGYQQVGRHREEHLKRGRYVDRVLTEVLRSEWEATQA